MPFVGNVALIFSFAVDASATITFCALYRLIWSAASPRDVFSKTSIRYPPSPARQTTFSDFFLVVLIWLSATTSESPGASYDSVAASATCSVKSPARPSTSATSSLFGSERTRNSFLSPVDAMISNDHCEGIWPIVFDFEKEGFALR